MSVKWYGILMNKDWESQYVCAGGQSIAELTKFEERLRGC
jgi:hypothetical protein